MVLLGGAVLEPLPVEPPYAFCPWFRGRTREWGVFGEWTFEEAKDFQGSIEEYLHTRNDAVPLIVATQQGNLPEVQKLLQGGVEIDAVGRDGETALHMASALGYVDIVKILLDHGAKIRSTEEHSTPLLHCARFCSLTDQSLTVAEMLLEAGDDPNKMIGSCTPLDYAFRRPLLPLARRLVNITNLSKRAVGNVNHFLMSSLDCLSSGRGSETWKLFLEHCLPHIQERDVFEALRYGGLDVFLSIVEAKPPIMSPSPTEWMSSRVDSIAFNAQPMDQNFQRSTSQVIATLQCALSFGMDPSNMMQYVIEWENDKVLDWVLKCGGRMKDLPRETLSEDSNLRHLQPEWRVKLLSLWDNE